jgi:hypothetical protein
MTNRKDNDGDSGYARMTNGKQTNAKSPGLRSETWGTQYLGYSDDVILL